MKMKVILLAALLAGVSTAQAHLINFGWVDNGNGSVTLWGEHWHGAQAGPSTANGGIHISGSGITPFTAQWTGHSNGVSRTDTGDRDAMVANGTLTGYQSTGFNSANDSNWFFTDPLVIGNGTFDFFTGTRCCIDTMSVPVSITLTGITSVPPGTGPGGTVSEPSSLILMGLGLVGMAGFARSRRKA